MNTKKSKEWNYDRRILSRDGPEIIVAVANGPDEKCENFRMITGSFVIDTGAKQTAINCNAFEALQLSGVKNVPIRGVGYTGEHASAVAYLTFSEFSDDVSREHSTNAEVEILSLPPGFNCFGLLGRDILSCAELTYNGVTGLVKLTFLEDQ